jgi:division protein CdvB (Snf7/Vps24/ESCRT-III family)
MKKFSGKGISKKTCTILLILAGIVLIGFLFYSFTRNPRFFEGQQGNPGSSPGEENNFYSNVSPVIINRIHTFDSNRYTTSSNADIRKNAADVLVDLNKISDSAKSISEIEKIIDEVEIDEEIKIEKESPGASPLRIDSPASKESWFVSNAKEMVDIYKKMYCQDIIISSPNSKLRDLSNQMKESLDKYLEDAKLLDVKMEKVIDQLEKEPTPSNKDIVPSEPVYDERGVTYIKWADPNDYLSGPCPDGNIRAKTDRVGQPYSMCVDFSKRKVVKK